MRLYLDLRVLIHAHMHSCPLATCKGMKTTALVLAPVLKLILEVIIQGRAGSLNDNKMKLGTSACHNY